MITVYRFCDPGETIDRSPSARRPKRSSAPKFYAVLHDRMARVGDTVRFQCSVSGHPPPWSSWEKDGRPVGINFRMRIREDDDHRSMELCDVAPEDAGLYRITVENKYGKIQATARLEVFGESFVLPSFRSPRRAQTPVSLRASTGQSTRLPEIRHVTRQSIRKSICSFVFVRLRLACIN